MIHFSCMYCGRKIRAKDKLVGRKAHCPACGHTLVIPKPSVPARATATADPAPTAPGMTRLWAGKSNKEIAKLLLRNKTLTAAGRGRAATKEAMSPLLPRYDELTLFALSVTFLLLLAISPEMKVELPKAATVIRDGRVYLALGIAAIGMVFSLFAIFLRRPKPNVVKWPMLVFAVVVTAGTGAYAGYVTLKIVQGRWWMMIFPAWNIINGVLLLLCFHAGLLDPDCILDRAAKFSQVVLTLICVGILLVVCEYGFKLHWAITYSVCVGYTMSLHHGLADVFGGVNAEYS